MDLRDKVIVITGASSGFGEQIARRCSLAGARIVLVARSPERLELLANELGQRDGQALAVAADVTSAPDVARVVSATFERFGRADVLVVNAGFGVLDRIVDAPVEDLREMIDVNVIGATRCLKALLPSMLQRRSGQIVIMGSLAGLMATHNMGYYSATKFALVGLARSLMLELHGTGVRCALICPGTAQTGFQQRADESKYPRITRLVGCTSEQVAQATMRAIRRRTHGEVVVPWQGRALSILANPIPGLTRFVIRLVG
ncbi:MAG TPA: SDR family NAD(P)-dependent oxidoreductase [Roseiflexaceae bacterium]|nr:SDR family NAD(P)-dependent oxidoreductase [Roseiflexaceae bacterium]